MKSESHPIQTTLFVLDEIGKLPSHQAQSDIQFLGFKNIIALKLYGSKCFEVIQISTVQFCSVHVVDDMYKI